VLSQPGASIPMLLVIFASVGISVVYWWRVIHRRNLMFRRASDRFSFFTVGILLVPALLTLPTFVFVEVYESEWPGAAARYLATVILLAGTWPILMDGCREMGARLRLVRLRARSGKRWWFKDGSGGA